MKHFRLKIQIVFSSKMCEYFSPQVGKLFVVVEFSFRILYLRLFYFGTFVCLFLSDTKWLIIEIFQSL